MESTYVNIYDWAYIMYYSTICVSQLKADRETTSRCRFWTLSICLSVSSVRIMHVIASEKGLTAFLCQ